MIDFLEGTSLKIMNILIANMLTIKCKYSSILKSCLLRYENYKPRVEGKKALLAFEK
jgi:hypothetical protein